MASGLFDLMTNDMYHGDKYYCTITGYIPYINSLDNNFLGYSRINHIDGEVKYYRENEHSKKELDKINKTTGPLLTGYTNQQIIDAYNREIDNKDSFSLHYKCCYFRHDSSSDSGLEPCLPIDGSSLITDSSVLEYKLEMINKKMNTIAESIKVK